MESHLSECEGANQSNRRNGKSKKQLRQARCNLSLKRPVIATAVLNESLDNKVLSLYALGMSYEAITDHLAELYGLEVSTAKISQITDKLLPVITEWRNRPLDSIYPIVFLDAMHFKVREEGRVVSKAIYFVLGVNKFGRKEVLGTYLSESEGANFCAGCFK